MKAKEFEKKFDAGKDISKHLDLSRARRVEQEQKRVNLVARQRKHGQVTRYASLQEAKGHSRALRKHAR